MDDPEGRGEARWLRALAPRSPAEFGLVWDLDGTILAATDAVAVLLDRPLTDLLGSSVGELIPGSHDLTPIAETTLKLRSGYGGSHWIHGRLTFDGECTILRGYDVTARESADAVLAEYAYTDSMTALHNRAGFLRHLEDALIVRSIAGVVYCDLDDFKTVNDSLGHSLGDLLLLEAVSRIRDVVGSWGDKVIGRMGGDEFAIAVPGAPNDVIALGATAQQLLDAFHSPFDMGTRSVSLSISVGVAPVSGLDQDHAAIMRQADTAMYRAKARGKNCAVTFDESFEVAARHRLDIEEALHNAIENGEFVAHYQPEMGLVSGRMELVEALVRWERPNHGLVSPGMFIAEAEECGLVVPIGEAMLRVACRQAKLWLDDFGVLAPAVSVNVAAQQMRDGRIVDVVRRALHETGLPPGQLRLEITETSLADPAEAGPLLERLHELGCTIAIDDFGTGYSSLAYLARLAVDDIKIDKAFIDEVRPNESAPLVDTILAMGQALGMHVDAEGVEKAHQVEYLRDRQCTRLQGFLLGRPMPSTDIDQVLGRARARASGSDADDARLRRADGDVVGLASPSGA